jgi:lysophospholipase L1-like esterase
MAELFANDAVSTLNGAINTSVTSLTITDATAFPAGAQFRIIIDDEILLVTSVVDTAFTITRAIEGTTAASHADGATIAQLVTVAGLEQWRRDHATVNPISPLRTSGDLLYWDPSTVTTQALGFVGDSITILVPGDGADTPADVAVAALSVDGLTVTATNRGIGGTTTADWLPAAGTGYLTAAKAQFVTDGVRIVHLMLGTNDAKDSVATSTSGFGDNVRAICEDLLSAGFIPVVSYSPFGVSGSFTGDFSDASIVRLIAYQTEIDKLVDGYRFYRGDAGAFEYFARHTGELSDGIHPNAAGATSLGGLWATALTPIVASVAQTVPLARLPIGSDGQIMSVTSGLPSWTDPASATSHYEPLTNGDTVSPAIMFDDAGDVLMIEVS